MSHFIEYCSECKKVINQCRCLTTDREVRWSVCDDCKQKEADHERRTS